ncbi:hypothetical protein [Sphingopyxis sp. GW247-27LB]|uniref:hypothetical protein n=1 Tax=Sphingopyxis sp. GW247-27LB TaxID=2012632 RepID=UPI000BA561BD|nr:hypothetical protein [Sphingopyxis sp. GW247-27LB]PAL23583.1 hypothetical protein CD928_05815 [Sphingopyxis sp. GW247-27LB]
MIWIVRLETENFEFLTYGSTESEANEAMGRALKRHARQYHLADDWWSAYEFETSCVASGEAYCDGERLV